MTSSQDSAERLRDSQRRGDAPSGGTNGALGRKVGLEERGQQRARFDV
jgi:hypothetical protein